MRRIVIAIAATLAILARLGSITPNRAAAMTVTTPSGMQNARSGCLSPRLALRTLWLRLAPHILAGRTVLRQLPTVLRLGGN